MSKLLGAAAAAAVLSLTCVGAASAAVVLGSLLGAPDPGPRAGENKVITFDGGVLPAGVTLTGDYVLANTSTSGLYAEPAGDTTTYLSTPFNGTSGAAELDFASFLGNRDVTHFSFYWGSIDSFNSIQLLDRSGNAFQTIGGPAVGVDNGSWTDAMANRRVTFTLTGADRNLGGILFTSTGRSFETDTFSFATVPEAQSWALMILGFGGVGVVLRRRRLALAA